MLAVILAGISAAASPNAQAAFAGPNGLIAFQSRDLPWGTFDIYVMHQNGSGRTRLTTLGGAYPAWSPDGTKIAFERSGDIYVMDADGSNQTQLANTPSATDIGPSWSPDGAKIAFASYGNGTTNNYDIWVMNADGSGQVNITNNPSEDVWPAWSPDGSQIAFQTNREGNSEIYTMNPDGSHLVNLTNSPAAEDMPDWSPDGSQIVFYGNRDTPGVGASIYRMNTDGSDVTRLTATANFVDAYPAWSPNGSKIVFHSTRDFNDGLYVMNADGSDPVRLTQNGEDWFPDWQPSADRPPNDDFAGAQSILGSVGIEDGWTSGATKETGEPDHAGDPGGSSIWYRWTAPASGRVTFSTEGSDFDTLLAAYTGSVVDALTQVTGNDDANGLLTSEIDFQAVQGTTYSIAIDGASGDSGLSLLLWMLHPPNDDFTAAPLLAGDHGSVAGTTVDATKEPSEPNHAGNAGGSSVWYRWTAPATGTLTLDTCDSDFDTLLAVYTGADIAHLTAVASNDDGSAACEPGSQLAFSVNAGTTYNIAVDGYDGEWGDFSLAWTRTNPPPPSLPAAQPPTNSAAPTIAGTPKAGQTLTAAPGIWNGTTPITFVYQWDSCDASGAECVALLGATTSTYLVSSWDAGSTLRVVVTASNLAGRASATSAQTAVVPKPLARCTVPKLKGKTVAKARTLLRQRHCRLGRVSHAHSQMRRGRIVSHRPRAGTTRPRGTKVSVVVSRGPGR